MYSDEFPNRKEEWKTANGKQWATYKANNEINQLLCQIPLVGKMQVDVVTMFQCFNNWNEKKNQNALITDSIYTD